MMTIQCPWCGFRPENEYHCGGSSNIQRPALDCSDDTWGEYMFVRDNPCDLHSERWRHTYGCSQWFNILRHTVTHEIRAVYAMTDPVPGLNKDLAP